MQIALFSISAFLFEQELDVFLVLYDDVSYALACRLFGELPSKINQKILPASRRREQPAPVQSFAQVLFKMIDEKGMSDVQLYKKAQMDRKLFSKIRTQPGYVPRKRTILALALALELDFEQTAFLLKAAGYALSTNSKQDRIVASFIKMKKFDLFDINEALNENGLPILP